MTVENACQIIGLGPGFVIVRFTESVGGFRQCMKRRSIYVAALLAMQITPAAPGAPGSPMPPAGHFLTNSPLLTLQVGDESLFGVPEIGIRYDLTPAPPRHNYGVLVSTQALSVPFSARTNLIAAPKQVTRFQSTEAAESINAEAMRKYREQFVRRRSETGSWPAPTLYPSRVQESLDNAR